MTRMRRRTIRAILIATFAAWQASCETLRESLAIAALQASDQVPPRFLQGMVDNDGENDGGFGGGRQMYQRCGSRNACQANLQCTRVPTGRVCLPMNCLEQAWREELEEQNLESAAYKILERAGFTNGVQADFFNETTARRGQLAIARERGQYLLKNGVVEALTQALEELPVDLDRFQARTAECTATTNQLNATTYQQDILYCGFQIEASFGGKLIYQLLTTTDTSTNTTSHFCFGAGPDVDFHVAFVFGGVLGADSSDDLNQCSLMIDGDVTVAAGLGWAVGWTLPNFKNRLELTGSAGLGGGFGIYGCVVA